ncbi:unnamed protein product [Protopolystoma xenopodis]|uniref:Uncharacterized protein n=1 Tax=Protopolystoma xenopodis TaxID=117903 RepID=A0A448WJJ2_9PLAT|nr:unnamed protein product [Protopolystoma xenopodis]
MKVHEEEIRRPITLEDYRHTGAVLLSPFSPETMEDVCRLRQPERRIKAKRLQYNGNQLSSSSESSLRSSSSCAFIRNEILSNNARAQYLLVLPFDAKSLQQGPSITLYTALGWFKVNVTNLFMSFASGQAQFNNAVANVDSKVQKLINLNDFFSPIDSFWDTALNQLTKPDEGLLTKFDAFEAKLGSVYEVVGPVFTAVCYFFLTIELTLFLACLLHLIWFCYTDMKWENICKFCLVLANFPLSPRLKIYFISDVMKKRLFEKHQRNRKY